MTQRVIKGGSGGGGKEEESGEVAAPGCSEMSPARAKQQ